MNKLVFDIGATNTKFALMTTEGEVLAKEKVPTVYDSAGAFFANLEQIVAKYRGSGDAIAISTNGRMDAGGDIYRAYIPQILQGVNLKQEMEARSGLPVTVLNDGFSAALGEWWKGSGQGANNLLVLVLGSGLGGGLILNGKLYEGSKRNAAMVFGMLGAYGGGKAELTSATTSFALLLYQLSAMKQIPIQEMTGQRFFEFAAEGDPAVLGMLELYCEGIAALIFNSALLLDLEMTVITGGLCEQELVMATIRRKLDEITGRVLEGEPGRFFEMTGGDRDDYRIPVNKGALSLDANVYGALYHHLHTT
ncbi:ROK family protein [Paenibacillus physcomitrellae]|uniref:Transcriptional regulator n=1 Tax=Paenibacillus physcomitrellae TaxID=1619311 RepID=A0ABQ1G060_9BACL|nr:ROK family protein [Paenibacillus physcomitrellae]GGA34824.1 transcriptional regulator [Paenibacillus physcomitrellae]